jgi:hypothetical protein
MEIRHQRARPVFGRKRGIDYPLLDNAFARIGDWGRAQQIVNGWEAKRIHRKLDEFAQTYRPIIPMRGAISSTAAAMRCSERWSGVGSTSFARRTRHSGAICRTRTAAKSRVR